MGNGLKFKAFQKALVNSVITALLALGVMLLTEAAITGKLSAPEPYLWVTLVLWLIVLSEQWYRQVRLYRSCARHHECSQSLTGQHNRI